MPSIPHDANHLRVDYVPKNMLAGIGGLDLGRYSPRDMYKPIIRSYPYPYSRGTRGSKGLDYSKLSPFIEHLDIATVWKGISLKDVETLFHIHEIFKASLELLVVDALQKLYQEFRGECLSYRPDLQGDLSDIAVTRKLKFSQSQLSYTMLRMSSPLEDQSIGETDQDFSMLLPMYLTTCDYLMKANGDKYQDTAIEVCAHYEEPVFRTIPPRIVAEAAWIPDTLSFDRVRSIYREGQELVIIPRYCSNSAFTREVSHRNVRYSLGSSQEWLRWDERISGFRGSVPLYSELRGLMDARFGKAYEHHNDQPYITANTIYIEIKAILTEHFPPRFRLERTVRARLSIKILPWYKTSEPSDDFVKSFVWQYEDDSYPPIPSRKTSLSSNSLGVQNLHEMLDGYNQDWQDWECSRPYNQRQPNDLSQLQVPQETPQIEPHKGQASPVKRYKKIDDESTSSVLPTLRDKILDYDHENEDFNFDPNSQADKSLDCTRSLPKSQPLLCFSQFSSLHGFQLDGSNEEGIDEKASRMLANLERFPISGSQPSQDGYKECNDHSSALTDSIGETYLENQDLTLSDIHMERLEIRESQATSMDAGSANTETMARQKDLWPRQSSPSFPNPARVRTPANSDMEVDQFASENGAACSDSSSMEIIVENPDVDPRIRREQAILWRFLAMKEMEEDKKAANLSLAEQRNVYDAMKESAEEDEARRNQAQAGAVDMLDDVFMFDGSNVDEGRDSLSNLEKSDILSMIGRG